MKKQSHRSGYGVFILPINCTVNYFLKLLSVDCFFKDFQEPVFLFKTVEENWWFSFHKVSMISNWKVTLYIRWSSFLTMTTWQWMPMYCLARDVPQYVLCLYKVSQQILERWVSFKIFDFFSVHCWSIYGGLTRQK